MKRSFREKLIAMVSALAMIIASTGISALSTFADDADSDDLTVIEEAAPEETISQTDIADADEAPAESVDETSDEDSVLDQDETLDETVPDTEETSAETDSQDITV